MTELRAQAKRATDVEQRGRAEAELGAGERELFEAYLPYALGVEQHWGERFASILDSIRNPDGSSYHPAWYAGSWNSFDLRSSTSGLSSGLNTAISSSVTPPSSSSGGGGFSGGGGGGGGGGW